MSPLESALRRSLDELESREELALRAAWARRDRVVSAEDCCSASFAASRSAAWWSASAAFDRAEFASRLPWASSCSIACSSFKYVGDASGGDVDSWEVSLWATAAVTCRKSFRASVTLAGEGDTGGVMRVSWGAKIHASAAAAASVGQRTQDERRASGTTRDGRTRAAASSPRSTARATNGSLEVPPSSTAVRMASAEASCSSAAEAARSRLQRFFQVRAVAMTNATAGGKNSAAIHQAGTSQILAAPTIASETAHAIESARPELATRDCQKARRATWREASMERVASGTSNGTSRKAWRIVFLALPSEVQFAPFLEHVLRGGALDETQAEAAFEMILRGEVAEAQIAELLVGIQARGSGIGELSGAARAMRRHATPVHCGASGVVLDTCGTGGAPKTFNVSTVAAIVTAAAGEGRVRVAKHGNTSRSGRGSAELLASLGVKVDAAPSVQSRCLERAGVCFSFAPRHHPAVKHVAQVRKSLNTPTMFNLLGPLTNPAGARHQLLGVYDPSVLETMATALLRLGSIRAMVVHGADGLDEITTTSLTDVAELRDGQVHRATIDPRALGLPLVTLESLAARDLDHAVGIAREVLNGGKGPCRDIVLLNAAAALVVAGCASDFGRGLVLAARAVDTSAAKETLRVLIEESHRGD